MNRRESMSKKKKALGAALAAATLILVAGCSTAVYFYAKSTFTITASGNVNLTAYDNSIDHTISGVGVDTPRVIPANSKSKAKIKLSYSIDGGNINVSGNYADGDVRFTFKGSGDILLAGSCGIGPNSCGAGINKNSLNKLTSNNSSRPSESGLIVQKGGVCQTVASLYESTNPAMPGTGLVGFVVCDAPTSSSIDTYAGADYVTVYVPNYQSGDLNPFANYYSGGTVSGEESSTSITVKYPATVPSATPTPIYPSPSPTTPAP